MRLFIWIIIILLGVNQLLIGSLIPQAAGTDIQPEEVSEMSSEIIPSGVPEIYGAELGISYDDVRPEDPQLANQTIAVLAQLDQDLELQGEDLSRYIDILYRQHGGISCEYCCSARAVIFEDGEMACGCAHSYAMRGLAKYLILEHGEEMTDEEILTEVGKWKVLFYPGIHVQKAAVMQERGIEVNYISLTTNANRGIK